MFKQFFNSYGKAYKMSMDDLNDTLALWMEKNIDNTMRKHHDAEIRAVALQPSAPIYIIVAGLNERGLDYLKAVVTDNGRVAYDGEPVGTAGDITEAASVPLVAIALNHRYGTPHGYLSATTVKARGMELFTSGDTIILLTDAATADVQEE